MNSYAIENGKAVLTESQRDELIDSDTGLCLNCGGECEQCEPDTHDYFCPHCGQNKVYGVPELIQMDAIDLIEYVSEEPERWDGMS